MVTCKNELLGSSYSCTLLDVCGLTDPKPLFGKGGGGGGGGGIGFNLGTSNLLDLAWYELSLFD